MGFVTGHIWACPPSEGDDYIFHCHPSDQKIPKPKRLQEWYKKMLDKAVAERIIHDYKVLQLSGFFPSFSLDLLSFSLIRTHTFVFSFFNIMLHINICLTSLSPSPRTFLNRQQRTAWPVLRSSRTLKVIFGLMCWRRALKSWSRRRKNGRERRTTLLVKALMYVSTFFVLQKIKFWPNFCVLLVELILVLKYLLLNVLLTT